MGQAATGHGDQTEDDIRLCCQGPISAYAEDSLSDTPSGGYVSTHKWLVPEFTISKCKGTMRPYSE